MEETTPAKAQHQKSYPVEFKLQVLDWYYRNGKNKLKTATHFNIHTKRIRDWELNEAFLRAHSDSPRRRFRMEKAAADTYGNIAKSLYQWYEEEKAHGTEHTFGDLKSKAVQLAAEQNVQDSFTVSDSWIRRWKKKYGVEDVKHRTAGLTETIVDVEGDAGNCMDTGGHSDVITLPTILQVQSDVVNDESIVYVSEPQQLAHASEEVIDMVENPLSSAETEESIINQNSAVASAISVQECDQHSTTLLEHLLMSLNETKKKLDQQELLTKQALLRAEQAEKGVSECKSRITVLELAMQQLKGSVDQANATPTVNAASGRN